MTDDVCCGSMEAQLNYTKYCTEHGNKCPDVVVRRASDGSHELVSANATYACHYCPWCGATL